LGGVILGWRTFYDSFKLLGETLSEATMIFNPAHPGEVLKDYLGGRTVNEASARLRVTRAKLSRIINFRRAPSRARTRNRHAGITAGMSLRLSAALGTSPDFWLKMQGQYDLWRARKRTPKVRRFPRAPNRQLAQELVRP
jgi:plasmid maintenance system antidote protein VapI